MDPKLEEHNFTNMALTYEELVDYAIKYFDWERVHAVMTLLRVNWNTYDNPIVPTIEQLKAWIKKEFMIHDNHDWKGQEQAFTKSRGFWLIQIINADNSIESIEFFYVLAGSCAVNGQ